MHAIPAIYMILTGATVGLIFGFFVKPRTVERSRKTQILRSAIAAGIGAAIGLVVFLLTGEAT